MQVTMRSRQRTQCCSEGPAVLADFFRDDEMFTFNHMTVCAIGGELERMIEYFRHFGEFETRKTGVVRIAK